MPKITECYMFICQDGAGPGDEGIPAFLSRDGMAMPLVTANKALLGAMQKRALEVSRQTGKRIRLVRFSVMDEMGEVEP